MSSMVNSVVRWFDERLDIGYFRQLAVKKEVPVHRLSWVYFLGGIVLFLMGIQLGTGILLLLYYRPSAQEAFESVQFVMTDVEFGWLIRSMHSWTANLLIGVAFLHMFTTYFMKAYRRPRELTWISGVLLFLLLLAFGFSGYLLPWNELAFFATKVGTDIVGSLPLVGEYLTVLLRGGEQVTGATLTRFFGLHVAILPALTTLLLLFHLLLVQKQGMSVPPRWENQSLKTVRFFPNLLLRDLVAWYVALAILVFLCAFYPWELGRKADPFAPAPLGIQPEWYFLFMFQTLKYIPAHVLGLEGEMLGVLAFGLGGVLWTLVPFLETFLSRLQLGRIMNIAGVVVVIYIVVLTVLALL